jgi:hypothetical protein
LLNHPLTENPGLEVDILLRATHANGHVVKTLYKRHVPCLRGGSLSQLAGRRRREEKRAGRAKKFDFGQRKTMRDHVAFMIKVVADFGVLM